MPAWIPATASLPAGFAVAQATGIRPLGGLVLAVLAVVAVRRFRTTWAHVAAWLALLLAGFAASHVLAGPLGTWGAVAAVTAVAGVAGLVLLDGRGPGRPVPQRA